MITMITKHDNNDNKNDNMITRLVTGNTKYKIIREKYSHSNVLVDVWL